MATDTRERILRAGSEIMHLKGYHHTGIQEILEAAGVPKGSFYNYFRSKEDFGLQVVDYFKGHFAAVTGGICADDGLPPLGKIRKILEGFIVFFRSRDFAYGCPVGNLAQEMGDLSPAFRGKLKEAIDEMAGVFRACLDEARARGEIDAALDPSETAAFIVSSWHGALVRMKVEKSAAALESHIRFIFDRVLVKHDTRSRQQRSTQFDHTTEEDSA